MSETTGTIVAEQHAEIARLEGVIEAMRSEVYYATYSSKSDDVKRHYLKNAIRYADEAVCIT